MKIATERIYDPPNAGEFAANKLDATGFGRSFAGFERSGEISRRQVFFGRITIDTEVFYITHGQVQVTVDGPNVVSIYGDPGKEFEEGRISDRVTEILRMLNLNNVTVGPIEREFRGTSIVDQSPTGSLRSARSTGPSGDFMSRQSTIGGVPRALGATETSRLKAGDFIRENFSRSTTKKMATSIATTQPDQSTARRKDPWTPLVIEGGPGTGKTKVGLERIPQLIFDSATTDDRVPRKNPSGRGRESVRRDHERLNPGDFLYLAPHENLVEYVDQVVVDLGYAGVAHKTFHEMLRERVDSRDFVVVRDEVSVARLKSNLGMVDFLRRVVASRVHLEPGKLTIGKSTYSLEKEDFDAPLREARNQLESGSATWDRLEPTVVGEIVGRIAGRSWAIRESRDDVERSVRKLLERKMKISTELDVLRHLRSGEPLVGVTRGSSDDLVLQALMRAQGRRTKVSVEDLVLLDEIRSILVEKPPIWPYKHVIVDEAQEFTPMEWRYLGRRLGGVGQSADRSKRSRCGLTVLGDLNQRVRPGVADSWDEALLAAGIRKFNREKLTVSIRTPAPILELASSCFRRSKLAGRLPVGARPGGTPEWRSVRDVDSLDKVIESELSSGNESDRWVVVTTSEHLLKAKGDEKVYFHPDDVRGQEFDCVIIREPCDWVDENDEDYRRLYVSLTRATKRLLIVHSDDRIPTRLLKHQHVR